MKYLKSLFSNLPWLLLGLMAAWSVIGLAKGYLSARQAFHIAYYIPPLGLLFMVAAQLDLLTKIQAGEPVNIKARAIDFLHWSLLVFIDIGTWLGGGATIWWFLTKLGLLAVIGWQIGVGAKRRWQPTRSERLAGFICMMLALAIGLAAGALRQSDIAAHGWGFILENLTVILSTMIVFWWITTDLKAIKTKASAYPRRYFWKGLTNNALIAWFLLHLLDERGGIFNLHAWSETIGLCINIIVGNALYLWYYLAYEYHRAKQRGVA